MPGLAVIWRLGIGVAVLGSCFLPKLDAGAVVILLVSGITHLAAAAAILLNTLSGEKRAG